MTDAGADDLIRHGSPMPDVPGPSDCPRLDMGVLGRDIRVVDGAYSLHDAPAGPPELYVWTRFASAPRSEAVQQALLAQPTTHYSIGAALRPHEGISEADTHRTISTGPVTRRLPFMTRSTSPTGCSRDASDLGGARLCAIFRPGVLDRWSAGRIQDRSGDCPKVRSNSQANGAGLRNSDVTDRCGLRLAEPGRRCSFLSGRRCCLSDLIERRLRATWPGQS